MSSTLALEYSQAAHVARLTKKNIKAQARRLAQEALEPKGPRSAVSAPGLSLASDHRTGDKTTRAQGAVTIPFFTSASDHRTGEKETAKKDQEAGAK